MKIRPSARPALGWLTALTLIGVVGSLWVSTAHAETTLVSSVPANGATLQSSPAAIELIFSEQIGPTNSVNMTCGEDSKVVPLGAASRLADGLSMSVPLVAAAPAGLCNVSWIVSTSDGQQGGSGSFEFTIAGTGTGGDTATSTVNGSTVGGSTPTSEPTDGQSTDTGDNAPAGDDTSSGPLALFRMLSNFGVALLFGAIVVIAVAWPEGIEYIITVRYLRSLWIFTAVSTYLFAGSAAASISGDGIGSALIPLSWGDLLDTTPGKAAFLRVVFVVITAFPVTRPERIIDPSAQFLALVPPGLAVTTMGFSRATFGLFDYGVGVVHGLTMAVWIGGLVLLTRVVLAGPGEEDLVHAVRGFSRISTPAMWATVATGAVLLFRLDRGALGTSHGLAVIFKTMMVAFMVFVAVAARQFISTRLSRVDVMTAPLALRLRRALSIEALLGVAVIGITGVLLTMSPPGLDPAPPPELQLAAPITFRNDQLGVEATVAFTQRVGLNDVRIELITVPATGITGLSVDFIPPTTSAVNGSTINVPLTGPGAAVLRKSSNFHLDAAGEWTIRVRVGDQIVATMPATVSEPSTIVEVTTPGSGSTPVSVGATTSTTVAAG